MKKLILSLVVMFVAVLSAQSVEYFVQTPEGTKACFIVGGFPDKFWNQTDPYVMEDLGEGLYYIDIANATTATEYKYICGPDWAYEEVIGGNRTWTEADVVTAWKNIWDPVAPNQNYKLQVTVPAGTKQVYANGTFNGWTGFAPLTNIGGDTWVLDGIQTPLKEIEYKYTCGDGWDYEEVIESNRKFPYVEGGVAVSNDIVTEWKAQPSGIKNATLAADQFSFAPGYFSVAFEGAASVKLYTMTGILIDSVTATGFYSKGNLPAGVYIVKVDGAAKKIIIKN